LTRPVARDCKHSDDLAGPNIDQRFYNGNYGRFMSPDLYKNSVGVGDPGSWNRYS